MLLYKDKISGDEMFSDAFPLKLIDGVVYEVDCEMITIKEGQVDIGANPSAEEAEEGVDDGVETVNNIVHSFRLQATSFDKKSYMSHIKGYLKTIKGKIEKELEKEGLNEEDQAGIKERVAAFEKGASAFVKAQLAGKNFENWEFYTGENMDPDGTVALLNYREDGVTPYFVFWKEGLEEQKL